MTIPFGRRRLVLTVALTPSPSRSSAPTPLVGADDEELARYSRRPAVDVDQAKWEGMALLYGGHRRP